MSQQSKRYRDPEDLTDSETEVHPNIEAKSFHHFMREEKRHRFEQLKSRQDLTAEERQELAELEYKFLPIADEVVEEGSYSMPSKNEPVEPDYSKELLLMLNNKDLKSFLEILDTHDFNMEYLEDYILLNESEAIKSGDDSLGYEFCRLSLLVKWAVLYGRQYIVRLAEMGEEQLKDLCESHYKASKKAILSLQSEPDV